MIKHQCPRCGRILVLPNVFAGQTHPCSSCGMSLHVAGSTSDDSIAEILLATQPILDVDLEPVDPEDTIPQLLPALPLEMSLEQDSPVEPEDIPELPLATPSSQALTSPVANYLANSRLSGPVPAGAQPLHLFRGGAPEPRLAAQVYVDNFSPQAVRLLLDGLRWRTVQSGSSTTTILRRESFTLLVLALDTEEELDRRTIEVGNAANYVLNVLGAQVYTRGVAYYGPANEPIAAAEETWVTDSWFQANEEYLFQEPPRSITVGAIAQGKPPFHLHTRTYLRRGK